MPKKGRGKGAKQAQGDQAEQNLTGAMTEMTLGSELGDSDDGGKAAKKKGKKGKKGTGEGGEKKISKKMAALMADLEDDDEEEEVPTEAEPILSTAKSNSKTR